MIDALGDAVAAAGWERLLPAHRLRGGDRPAGTPRCTDAMDLSDQLTLLIAADARGHSYPVPAVLGRDGGGRIVRVRRAVPGDGAAEALLALLGPGTSRRGGASGRFRLTGWHRRDTAGESAIPVDQTNESLIAGQAVVKWAFTADAGPHPAPSLLAELDVAGFTGMPMPWGAVEWHPPTDDVPRLIALVVDYLVDARDGWSWAVDDIRAAAVGERAVAARSAGEVGALIADFHRAVASTAQPASARHVASWRTSALADLNTALAVTAGAVHERLAAAAGGIREQFRSIPADVGPVMRVHGDLHIGQVLAVPATGGATRYKLTDFDGNPVVAPAERTALQPAATDVAGMAQSFIHAGLVVAKHHAEIDPPAVITAAEGARDAFLDAYRSGLGHERGLLDDRLLAPFALRQVCREFTYAATHLPRWSYVPEQALPMLLDAS